MIIPALSIIPRFRTPRLSSEIRVSPKLLEVSASAPEETFQQLGTSSQGLSEAEAARRLAQYGPNVVAQDKRHNHLRLLGRALVNPLVVLLSVLAVISALTGDLRAAAVMALMEIGRAHV